MGSTSRSRFPRLRFADPAQEQRYHAARDDWLRPKILPITLLISCLFLGFVLFDRVAAPDRAVTLAAIRSATAAVLTGIGLLTHFRLNRFSMDATAGLIAGVIYLGVFLTRLQVGQNPQYQFTEAVMLVQVGVWFLGGMTFSLAVQINALAGVAFLALEWFAVRVPFHDVLQSGLYLGTLGFLGGFAAFNIERQFRENFAMNELLSAQKQEYRARAMRDGLTGLWNRAAMEEFLALACRRSGETQSRGAALIVDLDRFKPVNDRFGHPAGDEVLIAVSRRIQSALRPGDSVGRIGGDEFLLLVEDVADEDFLSELTERIRGKIESPIRVRVHGDSASADVSVGASIGVTRFRGEDAAVEDIIRAADQDMYRDKSQRRTGPADSR